MKKNLVIVDNGHGIETRGKCSPDGRHREWHWSRIAGRRLAEALERNGMEAALLVPEEADVSLRERCRRAAVLSAGRRAVLVSIHNNAAGDGSRWLDACGWSVFVGRNASVQSRRLAGLLFRRARSADILGNRATPTCGYWTADLAICRDTPCPAVLTENMFQDNRADVAFLASESGLSVIVDVHLAALKEFFGLWT